MKWFQYAYIVLHLDPGEKNTRQNQSIIRDLQEFEAHSHKVHVDSNPNRTQNKHEM